MSAAPEQQHYYCDAVRLKGPDGVERLYVPVPDAQAPEHALFHDQYVRRFLGSRRRPVSCNLLANLMGVHRTTVLRDIERGVFPQGSILKFRKAYKIDPAAALWYYESLRYDPQE